MIFQPPAKPRKPPAPDSPTPAASTPESGAEAPSTPAPDQSGESAAGEDEELGLLGDVQIEFIPELGVIILRGNKRDVERVQEIIDEIEKESEATVRKSRWSA